MTTNALITQAKLFSVILIFSILLPATVGGSTFTVRMDGSGDFEAIRFGLEACSTEGDTVLVGPGIYSGPDNRNLEFYGKDIVLIGEQGAENTIIDGELEGRGFKIHEGESNAAVIKGFTIRNCSGYAIEGGGNGGGIRCDSASPTLDDLVLVNCDAPNGGGFSAVYGNPILTRIRFENNSAGATGGGATFYDVNTTFSDLTFLNNWGSSGGGLRISNSEIVINGALFEGNDAGYGGGCKVELWSTVHFSDVQFIANSAHQGGAAFLNSAATVTFDSCDFIGNHSSNMGGGLACMDGDITATITNSLFQENYTTFKGAGVYGATVTANIAMDHCTVVGNYSTDGTSAQVHANSATITVQNTIVAEAGEDTGGLMITQGGTFEVGCCDVWGNPSGNYIGYMDDQTGLNGNISEDPLFCGDTGSLPWALHTGSPCLPENNNCGVLMGYLGAGCEVTATHNSSWSTIKSIY